MRIRRTIRKYICLLLTLAVAGMLTGCTSFDNFRRAFIDTETESSNVIYVGVFEPESGESKETGEQEIKGIELANSNYNTVKGVRVELIKMDTESNTAAAQTAIQDLIKMNPVAIIGSTEEANSMIAAAAVKKAKIPMITPSACNPLITEDNDYMFRACITYSQRGDGLAEYAIEELESKKIGIITIKNDSTYDAMSSAFKDRIKKNNKKNKKNRTSIVLDESVDLNDFDAEALVKAIGKSGADTVFAPVGLENASKLFDEMEKQGLTDITVLGNQDWTDSDLLKMAEKHPDIHIAFTTDNVLNTEDTTESLTAETQRFFIKYANKYGENDEPTQNALLGYDAYMLIINAINNADSLDPKDIRDALAETKDLRCATGVYNFDSDGNPIRRVNISTVKDGKITTAYVTESSSQSDSMKKIGE